MGDRESVMRITARNALFRSGLYLLLTLSEVMSDLTNSIYLVVIFFQEKDRDGCPKIVNLGSSKTDLFYEMKKYGFKKR